MNLKLYEIAHEYKSLIEILYDEDGNENPQVLAALEESKGDFNKKAISIASWIKNMQLEQASIAEAKRQVEEAKKDIAQREKALENKIVKWKDYLKSNMENSGISKISSPYFELKLVKNNPSVQPYDEKQVPDEYWVIEKRLNKSKMLTEMKMGVIIPGANLKQEMRLDIK